MRPQFRQRRWLGNRQGYTLTEVAATAVVVAAMAGLALPQFTVTSEKSKASEAVQILAAIWQSQQLYILENKGTASGSTAALDIDIPTAPTHFAAPVLYTTNGQTAYIDRSSGDYRLYVNSTGNITCDDTPGLAGICAKMGYTAYPF